MSRKRYSEENPAYNSPFASWCISSALLYSKIGKRPKSYFLGRTTQQNTFVFPTNLDQLQILLHKFQVNDQMVQVFEKITPQVDDTCFCSHRAKGSVPFWRQVTTIIHRLMNNTRSNNLKGLLLHLTPP